MISDDERREVARKLRELETGVIGTVIPTGELYKNILDVIEYGHSGAMTPYGLLADLIDPTIPAAPGDTGLASVEGFIGKMRHSTKEEQDLYSGMLEKMSVELYPVDRDALLSLADEIDANVDRLLEDSSLLVGDVGLMRCYANSIRKSLGETRKE